MTVRPNLLSILPDVPWVSMQKLTRETETRAWATCVRQDDGHCINSNFVRAFAAYQGRSVRFVQTYKGFTWWSECLEGVWCRLRSPLSLSYAMKIDAFDASGKHFKPPTHSPMGSTEFLKFCPSRHDDYKTVTIPRKARHAANKEAGTAKSHAAREPQTQYVAQ